MNQTHLEALQRLCGLSRAQAERAVRADAKARAAGAPGFTARAGGATRTKPAARSTAADRAGVERLAATYYRERAGAAA